MIKAKMFFNMVANAFSFKMISSCIAYFSEDEIFLLQNIVFIISRKYC